MALQSINLGVAPSGAGGDAARTAFEKMNANFSNPAHAASKLAQTSPTDTTAGALMAVGAFGWGQLQSISNTASDANAPLANGLYRVTSATTGHMLGGLIGQMLHAEQNAGYAVQLALATQNPVRAAIRVKNAGIWQNPAELFHTGNILGTVSTSSGVPTGAIIERGSNANGEYVRFADGTQICWKYDAASLAINNTANAIAYSDLSAWAFPAQFVSSGSVSANASPRSSTRWATANVTSTSGMNLRQFGYAASSGLVETHVFAIGRWY